MKNNRRIIVSILWVLLGLGLIIAARIAEIDAFWSGMGSAFIVVGALQIFRWIKYARDPEYREQTDVNAKDERNRYLAGRAWGWAGYLFVLISALSCIVLRIAGQELLCFAASWNAQDSYLILKRKY